MAERISIQSFLERKMDDSRWALEKKFAEKRFWGFKEIQISWLSETGREISSICFLCIQYILIEFFFALHRYYASNVCCITTIELLLYIGKFGDQKWAINRDFYTSRECLSYSIVKQLLQHIWSPCVQHKTEHVHQRSFTSIFSMLNKRNFWRSLTWLFGCGAFVYNERYQNMFNGRWDSQQNGFKTE